MERFGQMLQIDASPFYWLSNGSMISLHGAIDDATGNVTALRFERTECLDGYFRVLEETIPSFLGTNFMMGNQVIMDPRI